MKVLIHDDRCTGHGRCYTLVSALFDADDQGHGVALIDGSLTEEQIALVHTAVLNCPEQAISLVDD